MPSMSSTAMKSELRPVLAIAFLMCVALHVGHPGAPSRGYAAPPKAPMPKKRAFSASRQLRSMCAWARPSGRNGSTSRS
jgi:hypothetical protein